jgi:tellurite methyltransferase
MITRGGYDDGYAACPCFWGQEPSSLVVRLTEQTGPLNGTLVLDAGCGEGKNAVYLARHGAIVHALDVSTLAISNGKKQWSNVGGVTWLIKDISKTTMNESEYDVVIAYGMLHCLQDEDEITSVVRKLQAATKCGGYNVLCAFNSRKHCLLAHPNLTPCLLDHSRYVNFYKQWEILTCTDSDLEEAHPHNNIRHQHSLTRILARKR